MVSCLVSCFLLHVCCLQTRILLLASSMSQLAISVASAEKNKHSLGKGSLPVNANKTHFRPFLCALLRSVSQTVNKRPDSQQIFPVPFPWKLAESQVRRGRCDCGSGDHPCQITSAASAQRCFSCFAREMSACAPDIPAYTWLLSKIPPFGLNENQRPPCLNPDRFLYSASTHSSTDTTESGNLLGWEQAGRERDAQGRGEFWYPSLL